MDRAIKIPVSSPSIDKSDISSVTECLESGWISSMGGFVEKFQENFSSYIGKKYGVATNSGTTSLHLALAALGLKKDDEIIMPTFTMIATINAAEYLGLKVKLVDADLETWNMDLNDLEEKVSENTKAIMPVHIYGHPENMEIIEKIAKKYNLWVVEDAAEAHGAEAFGKKAGSFGDISSFSFYANKIITTGEGGIAITDDPNLSERMIWLRAHAFGRGGKHFWHEELGYGYRMSALQAALGVSQLGRIDKFVAKRREFARIYNENLRELQEAGKISLPVEKPWAKNVYWMYSILVKDGYRDKLMEYLANKGIETRTFFYPVHRQPYYSSRYGNLHFPIADRISIEGMNLPSGNSMSNEQVFTVTNEINNFFSKEVG